MAPPPKKLSMNWNGFLLLLLLLLLKFHIGQGELKMNYYSSSCPNAEKIIQEQVSKLYDKHKNTAFSWVRNLFHDCMVMSCDASLLLDTDPKHGIVETEKDSIRSFGMRNFKYINTIKEALESQCPSTVSCADIIAISARDAFQLLQGPYIPMKTGRKDSRESYFNLVEKYIPNHNDSISSILSSFQSIGIDTEATVALLGAHSVGRTHCANLVQRLYPTVDPTLDPEYADYLKHRCSTPDPDPKAVLYARNDRMTPMIIDNNYYKNLLSHKGLFIVDQELGSDPRTLPYVTKMAGDNEYFYQQFVRGMILLSENNALSGDDEGEIRKDCRFVNSYP